MNTHEAQGYVPILVVPGQKISEGLLTGCAQIPTATIRQFGIATETERHTESVDTSEEHASTSATLTESRCSLSSSLSDNEDDVTQKHTIAVVA